MKATVGLGVHQRLARTAPVAGSISSTRCPSPAGAVAEPVGQVRRHIGGQVGDGDHVVVHRRPVRPGADHQLLQAAGGGQPPAVRGFEDAGRLLLEQVVEQPCGAAAPHRVLAPPVAQPGINEAEPAVQGGDQVGVRGHATRVASPCQPPARSDRSDEGRRPDGVVAGGATRRRPASEPRSARRPPGSYPPSPCRTTVRREPDQPSAGNPPMSVTPDVGSDLSTGATLLRCEAVLFDCNGVLRELRGDRPRLVDPLGAPARGRSAILLPTVQGRRSRTPSPSSSSRRGGNRPWN